MTVIRFTLRSSACVRLPANRRVLQTMAAAVPATGRKGVAVRRAVHLAAGIVPPTILRLAPGVAVLPDPAELATLDELLPWLADQGIVPHRAVVTRPPADDTTGRFAALLTDETGAITGHVRVMAAAPTDAAPADDRGTRSGVVWPRPLARTTHGAFHVELATALPIGLHRPTHLPVADLIDLVADIGDTLGATEVMPMMHGDLTPWNLRTYPDGTRALFDWEFAGPGPRHADLVRYLSAAPDPVDRFLEVPESIRGATAEAIAYWRDLTHARAATRGDSPWVVRNRNALLETFDRFDEAIDP